MSVINMPCISDLIYISVFNSANDSVGEILNCKKVSTDRLIGIKKLVIFFRTWSISKQVIMYAASLILWLVGVAHCFEMFS